MAHAPLNNPKSKELRKHKCEKELETVFNEVAITRQYYIDYVQLGIAMKKLGLFKTSSTSQQERRSEEEVKMHEQLWKALDPQETGWTDFESFAAIILPVMNPDMPSSTVL